MSGLVAMVSKRLMSIVISLLTICQESMMLLAFRAGERARGRGAWFDGGLLFSYIPLLLNASYWIIFLDMWHVRMDKVTLKMRLISPCFIVLRNMLYPTHRPYATPPKMQWNKSCRRRLLHRRQLRLPVPMPVARHEAIQTQVRGVDGALAGEQCQVVQEAAKDAAAKGRDHGHPEVVVAGLPDVGAVS